MEWVIIIFIFAFLLILKGGDLLVESSIALAKKAKIPSMVVGATVVALATTFPEISVCLMSGLNGAESLAVNTSLGSMIGNFALVLGLSFLCLPTKLKRSGFLKNVVFFLIALMALFILGLDQSLTIIDACILLIIFIIFILTNFFEARNSTNLEPALAEELPSWGRTILQFFVSAFSIGFGANVLVNNVESLSNLLGISEGLIGMIIIAVGTNIPEFVTTITSVRLKDSAIGIGNIFGASLIDSTLLIAVTVLSSKTNMVVILRPLLFLTVGLLTLITAIIVIPIVKKGKSNRIQGVLLIILFIIYSLILAKIT